MKVVAIIQARMGSTRLPGKVLMDLTGEPMLARVVNRCRRATTVKDVMVATSIETSDNDIAELCKARGWPCFRGSHDNLLDRYYQAARQTKADAVVRITSDCPLIEPEIIDRVVLEFQRRQPHVHYAANTWPRRTYPRGLDTEIVRRDALDRAWREDKDPASREHATPYLYRHPELFQLQGVNNEDDHSSFRWTVDTVEDRDFVRRVYDHFGDDQFTWREVLAVLRLNPEWVEINRHVEQKAA